MVKSFSKPMSKQGGYAMFMLNHLNFRQKLILLIGLLLAIILVIMGTQSVVNQAWDEILEAYNQRYTSYRFADELRQNSDDLTRLVRTYVITGDARWEQQYNEVVDIQSGKIPRPAGYGGIYWDFRAVDMPIPGQPGEKIALLDLMKRAGFSSEELAKLSEAEQKSTALIDTEVIAMNLVKGLLPDGKGGFTQGAPDLVKAREILHDTKYHQARAEIGKPINAFFELLDHRTQDAINAATARATHWENIQALSIAAAFIVFFIALYSIFAQITASMRHAIQTIADSDLTRDLHSSGRDEIAQLLNILSELFKDLADVVITVRDRSNLVAAASAQIAQANHNLSARTESQASALQQTAASMEELSATVQQNTQNAQQANMLAQNASTIAGDGGQVVSEMVHTMQEISDSSKQIAEIISVIDGIAFQTNILALNAAVEAARAGEQGRGFAVVASEVRTLAGRSAEAAKEIKNLITDSVNRVEVGSELVERAGKAMGQVVSSIRKVTDIMGEISSASVEQNSGMHQISAAITQMDQATQQNAALVEEMSAAATSLQGDAQELVQTVAMFKLGEEGGAAPTSPPKPKLTSSSNTRPGKPTAPRNQRQSTKARAGANTQDWDNF